MANAETPSTSLVERILGFVRSLAFADGPGGVRVKPAGGLVEASQVAVASQHNDWPRAAADGKQPRVMRNAHCNVLHDAFF